MGEFKLISDYTPGGDQPQAIEKLAQGSPKARDSRRCWARRERAKLLRSLQVIQKVQRPTLVIAHNKTLAAQLCARVPRVLPAKRRRVFRLLLRLLPARSLHPADRHLHRKRQPDQRRDQPPAPLRHARPAGAPRRDRRRLRLLHLRPGLAGRVQGDRLSLQARRGLRPRRRPAPPDRYAVHPQQHGADARHVPRARRYPGNPACRRRDHHPRRVLRRRCREDHAGRPADRRDHRQRGITITVFPASHFVTSKERLERAIVDIEGEMQERVAYFTPATN